MVVEDECKTVFLPFIGGPRKLNAMAKPIKEVWVWHMVAFENQELLTVLTAGPMQSHNWKNQRRIERDTTWQCSTSVLGNGASVFLHHKRTYWGWETNGMQPQEQLSLVQCWFQEQLSLIECWFHEWLSLVQCWFQEQLSLVQCWFQERLSLMDGWFQSFE